MPKKGTKKKGFQSLSAIAKQRQREMDKVKANIHLIPEEFRDNIVAAYAWLREFFHQAKKHR